MILLDDVKYIQYFEYFLKNNIVNPKVSSRTFNIRINKLLIQNIPLRNGGFKEIAVNRGNEINSNWYSVLSADSAVNQRMR